MDALTSNTLSEFISQTVLNPVFMTFLLALILSITLGEIFKRVSKSRILGFLVAFATLIWISGEIVKGQTIFDVLLSVITLLAFFIAAFIVALKVFVKKLAPKT